MMGTLILALVGGLVLLFFVTAMSKKNQPKQTSTNFNLPTVQLRWSEINTQMQTPSGLKNALIEADKLLDYVLKGKGYNGTTMAERLKLAQSQFQNREAVWQAHKLRNTLVHEVNIDIVPAQLQASVKSLGQGITDLGVKL